MLCPKCQKWEIGKQDVYCGWCRWKLVDFSVSLNAGHLYVNELNSDLTLTIAHTGPVGNLRLDGIESDKVWLKVDKSALADPILRQGKTIELPVELETIDLPDDYHEARVTVSSFVGARVARLEIVPSPEIRAVAGDYTALLDPANAEPLHGHLFIARGVATVTEVRTDASWAKIELAGEATFPFRLDARSSNRLDLRITLDYVELLRQMGNDASLDHTVQLWAKYAEFNLPNPYSFRLTCLKPPKLVIPEETGMMFNLALFTGKRGELGLTLQNGSLNESGRADLQILGINIESPYLKLTGASQYPLIIGSGQSQSIRFTAFAPDSGTDRHVAKISFLTNQISEEKPKEIFVEIDVKEMLDYEGVIAIDFGTVNSCCAFTHEKGENELIPLDRFYNPISPNIAPSTILYHKSLESGMRDYEIGLNAYKLSFDLAWEASAVRQIKRDLGKSERRTITYKDDLAKQDALLPREITADILKRILEHAEDKVKARIKECTITHPSRFSLKQIEDLKAALVLCGIDREKIKTVHEPLGAALDYIVSGTELGKTVEYHLMVYDFGGGTTDISLLRVTAQYDPEGDVTVVTPTVLGMTGNRWLGGEDITDMAIDIILKKIELLLPQLDPKPKETIELPFHPNTLRDSFHTRYAKKNQLRLREFSEMVKISISENDSDYHDEGDEFVTVIKDGKVEENVKLKREDIAPSKKELMERLRPLLVEMVEMMRQMARNAGVISPEVIVLSGKSSAFPIVQEEIRKVFPESETRIHMPKELKECVVKGACDLYSPTPKEKLYINIKHSQYLSATTSYLGIQVNKQGQRVFHKLIDAGVPIPPTGLRVQVKGIPLRRETRIKLLENTSLKDELAIEGEENPNISEVDTFRMDKRLGELEQATGIKVPDEALRKAKIELEVMPNLSVRLIATIPGVEQPLEFETELSGW